jgi:hypothetical protein
LIEHWDGHAWSVVSTLNPAGARSATLVSIACPSTINCFAVGSYRNPGPTPDRGLFDRPFAEHWNGMQWSLASLPMPGDAIDNVDAQAVSCPTRMTCDLVGNYEASSGDKLLAEHWSGTSWSVVPVPNPSPTTEHLANLAAVACPAVTSCYAVGEYETTPDRFLTLIEHWNGTAWSVVASPNPVDATESRFAAVACASATACFAAGATSGNSGQGPLIERWDGAAWSISNTAPGGDAAHTFFSGVACVKPTRCFATGAATSGATVSTRVERWNGTTWSVLPSPDPVGGSNSFLVAVACPAAGDCESVGSYSLVGSATRKSLAEHWSGSVWSLESPPSGASESQLAAVACESTTSCLAVGSYEAGSTTRHLIERWNGSAWVILGSPSPSGAIYSVLNGVTCVGLANCYAVGYDYTTSGQHTLIEHWNGATWTVIASPDAAGSDASALQAISCSSATMCVAVGSSDGPNAGETLAEHWDGAHWSVVPTPATHFGYQAVLNGVACANATSCDAVGTMDTNPVNRGMAEHWNGTSWSVVPIPNPAGTADSRLSGVACVSATNCFAVGNFTAASKTRSLIERWNGTSWSVANVSGPSTAIGSRLDGIVCVSAMNCTAVGNFATNAAGSTMGATLVERWGGSSWSIMSSANPAGAFDSALRGVACANPASCVAVGHRFAQTSSYTLAERNP